MKNKSENKNENPEQSSKPEEYLGPAHGRQHHHEHTGEDRDHHDFWRDWRHGSHEMDIPIEQALSPKEIEAWRDLFLSRFGAWPEDHWLFGRRRFSPWHQGIESFNPFVASLLSKGGGLLPLYLLHLVAQKPRYGNEIMQVLVERTNGQWLSNPGAVYPLLTLLEHEGFITGEWEDPDKRTIRVYTITDAGLEEVRRLKGLISSKIQETVQVLQALHQDLQDQVTDPTSTGEVSQ